MDIKSSSYGDYRTNCYIVSIDEKDFIIDQELATAWVKQNAKNQLLF